MAAILNKTDEVVDGILFRERKKGVARTNTKQKYVRVRTRGYENSKSTATKKKKTTPPFVKTSLNKWTLTY